MIKNKIKNFSVYINSDSHPSNYNVYILFSRVNIYYKKQKKKILSVITNNLK